MNNLKKIGLTALGTALVTSTAVAGSLDVTGTAGITYVGNSGTDNGNSKLAQKTTISFTGSADLDNGVTVSYYNNVSGASMAAGNSHFDVDMGDMGILSFDSTAGALVGVTANDDLMPTAYEEASTGVSTKGVTGVGSTNVIGYRNTFGMFSVSAGYSQKGTSTAESGSSGEASHGSTEDIYVSMSGLIDGLTIGAGTGEVGVTQDEETMYIKYDTYIILHTK